MTYDGMGEVANKLIYQLLSILRSMGVLRSSFPGRVESVGLEKIKIILILPNPGNPPCQVQVLPTFGHFTLRTLI